MHRIYINHELHKNNTYTHAQYVCKFSLPHKTLSAIGCLLSFRVGCKLWAGLAIHAIFMWTNRVA